MAAERALVDDVLVRRNGRTGHGGVDIPEFGDGESQGVGVASAGAASGHEFRVFIVGGGCNGEIRVTVPAVTGGSWNVRAGVATSVTSAALQVSPGITFLIGLVASIAVMIQWAIMIGRGPIVVVLLGVWPLTAGRGALV